MAISRLLILLSLSSGLTHSVFPEEQQEDANKTISRPVGHWPQWRGVDRLNRSADTGLLQSWPKDGPPLLWQVNDIGLGVGGVAVAKGCVYVLGHCGEVECLSAMDKAACVATLPMLTVRLAPLR